MLSQQAKNSIRALIYLARLRGQGPVAIREMSERLGITRKFLEAILLELRNHGILQSRMGKVGGYLMERAPDTITLGKVIRLVDGTLASVPCVSQIAYSRCSDCPSEATCAIRCVMKDLRDANARILDSTTIADLIRTEDSLGSGPPALEYQI